MQIIRQFMYCFSVLLCLCFFYSVFLILQQEKASTATLFLSLPVWLCTDAAAASCYFSVGSQVCTIGVIQCTCSMSPFHLRNQVFRCMVTQFVFVIFRVPISSSSAFSSHFACSLILGEQTGRPVSETRRACG